MLKVEPTAWSACMIAAETENIQLVFNLLPSVYYKHCIIVYYREIRVSPNKKMYIIPFVNFPTNAAL